MLELVECLSSPSYPGQPIALTWEGERREVEAILERWRSPEAIGFRVRTTRSTTRSNDLSRYYDIFELVYDVAADSWRVTLSSSPPRHKDTKTN